MCVMVYPPPWGLAARQASDTHPSELAAIRMSFSPRAGLSGRTWTCTHDASVALGVMPGAGAAARRDHRTLCSLQRTTCGDGRKLSCSQARNYLDRRDCGRAGATNPTIFSSPYSRNFRPEASPSSTYLSKAALRTNNATSSAWRLVCVLRKIFCK
jgi:hypothetical protein